MTARLKKPPLGHLGEEVQDWTKGALDECPLFGSENSLTAFRR
jgi:hypothetical protein